MRVEKASEIRGWLDTSTQEGRRKTLRMLVKAVVGLWVAAIAIELLWGLPEDVRTAVDRQWDSMTSRQVWTMGIMLVVISCSSIYGIYRTWRFQSDGPFFFAIGQFCPPAWKFASASTPAADYFWHLATACVGMLLFLCWTQPDVFDTAPDAKPPASGGST